MTAHDTVLVVDFGAQYAQLIARRVREAKVYSEIVPHTMPVEQMLARQPKAIILSGGPSSVYEPGAPQLDPSLEHGIDVDRYVAAAIQCAAHVDASRIGQRHARFEQRLGATILERALGSGELRL